MKRTHMDRLNQHRFAIAALCGIAALLITLHIAARSMERPPIKPVAPILSAALINPVAAPQLSVAQQPAIEVSASDDYARARGYRNWNHYLAHRPSNKMGVREDDESPAPDIAPVARYTTFDPAELEEQQYPPVQYIEVDEPELITFARPLLPSDPPDWIERPTTTVKPVSSVPEPSSLSLLGVGFVAIVLMRARKQP